MTWIKKIFKNLNKFIFQNAALVILLTCFFATIDYFYGGPYSYIKIHDNGDAAIPCYISLARNLSDYGLYQWRHDIGSGADLASTCTQLNNIVVILYYLFPGWLAYQLIILLQHFVASYYILRINHDYLKFDPLVCLLSSLVVIFIVARGEGITSGYYISIFLFPMLVYYLERLLDSQFKGRHILIAGIGFAFSYFFAQISVTLPFILCMLLLWFVFVRRKYSRDNLRLLFVFCVFTILAQLRPMAAILVNSSASHRNNNIINLQEMWNHYMEDVITNLTNRPMVYFHILAGILLLVALFKRELRGKIFPCLALWYLTSTICTFLPYFFQATLMKLNIKFNYNLSRFAGFYFFTTGVLLGMLSWLGQKNSDEKSKKLPILPLIRCALVFLLFDLAKTNWDNRPHHLRSGWYVFNYEQKAIIDLAEKTRLERQQRPFRIMSVVQSATGDGNFYPDFFPAYGLETPGGYLNIYPMHYKEYWHKIIAPFLSLPKNASYKSYFEEGGARVYLYNTDEEPFEFQSRYNLNLLSMLNVKYIVSPLQIIEPNFRLVSFTPRGPRPPDGPILEWIKGHGGQDMDLYIYENKVFLPRFFLVNGVQTFEKDADVLRELSSASATSLRSVAFTTKQIYDEMNLPAKLDYHEGRIELLQYTPDLIKLNTMTDGSAILIVGNSYSPNWKCLVNGQAKKIHRLNNSLWGIVLDKGISKIDFSYELPI